ncbi:MAG: type VI secretion system tip protein TssI/VgrG [Burkholderiales bacterium]
MPTATDSKRIGKAHTPVSSLVFRQISGREELSRLFEYKLELIAEDDKSIDPKALLGRSIVAEIMIQGGGSRYINGECVRFSFAGAERAGERNTTLWRYDAVLRPWLWYATRTSTCKIWQKMTVPDIVKAVLAKYPFSADWRISRPYREWNYCVQYEETDFNFVSRLLEHEGIYYWFEHSIGACTLVLADDMGAHSTLPGYGTIPFMLSDMMARPDEEWIDDWHMVQEVDSGRYVTDDYYYRTPSAELKVERQKPLGFPWDDQEVYEWPGGYTEPSPWGEQYAQTRIEELQQSKEIVSGRSNVRGLAPGYLFTLERSQRYDQDRQYMIRSVSMYLRDNAYTTGGAPADWQFVFEAQPLDYPYRPARLTRKPLINGPQTAVVTGPESEEIYTDDEGLGRVKVWFPWDREKDVPPQDRSCWIRVSTTWAGNKWGQISLPRIGQEVIVEYIDGDPDYPIITGRCYNQEHVPPYTLPKYKEYSTIKSHSTKKGGPMEWNELRFYDYKGKEQVFIHCQWRMDVRVKWNKYETVKESSYDCIGKSYVLTVGGSSHHHAYGDYVFEYGGSWDGTADKNILFGASGDGGFIARGKLDLYSGKTVTVEGVTSIVLKVGANFIEIGPAGVTIQGTLVKINSGGGAAGVADPEYDSVAGCEHADTGEEGYLDRPKKPGGGPPKKKKWKLDHAVPFTVTKQSNGDLKLGNGLVIKNNPADPDFQTKALRDLAIIASTKKGSDTLNSIDQSGKQVTIEKRPATQNNFQTTPKDYKDSVAKGKSYFRDDDGTKHEFDGTGKGTDSTITYQPDDGRKMSNGKDYPSDVGLQHELDHSNHMAHGKADYTDSDPADAAFAENKEEVAATKEDNEYRKERDPSEVDIPQRTGHGSL